MIHTETEEGFPVNIPYSFRGYKFLNLIGYGSTSIVGLVEEEDTCQLFSAKIIPKQYLELKNLSYQIQKEIAVMGEVDHFNITKIYRTFELKNSIGESYIISIMEYCENGDLLTYITENGFENEHQRNKILKGILNALNYLHKRGISHGDIKPENILLDSDFNPKLSDFGYCRTTLVAGDEAKSGTLYYAAPELFAEGQFDTLKTDIWALGITLYCLSEKRFPYKKGDSKSVIKQITSGNLSISPNVSDSFRKVIEKCTDLSPENRPSIEELMKYDYFNEIYDCTESDPYSSEDTESYKYGSGSCDYSFDC